jgi:hypothetical protein
VLGLAVGAYAAERARAPTAQPAREAEAPGAPRRGPPERSPLELAMLVLSLAIGALMFAGALAGEGHEGWPGLIAGVACAALGYLAVARLFARARRRVDPDAAALLSAQADGVALVVAALSIVFDPVGYLALAAFLVLAVRGRGEGERKYGGLRVLR